MTDERNGNGNKTNNNNNSSSSNNNNSISHSSSTSVASNNNNNNSGSSSSGSASSNNNERLIAEAAAKFLLKNGINGTNAAAAAASLLTAAAAAATFQLPATPELKPAHAATTPSTSSSSSVTSNGTTPTLSSSLSKINSSSSSSSSSLSMATASATALTATALAAPRPPPVDVMAGVLDYSALNGPSATSVAASAKSTKFGGNGNGSNTFDMGRHPISSHSNNTLGYGGRLQFFKDGKFILELARAKEGDKAGWVSVPRKAFRTPSAATSATVTPTSAVTTTYPKNENSTSLSFSDDNSSIQSSPWQRDQPWKQTRPRRGISKELSLYYQRPRNNVLKQSARKAAARKRRRPYELSAIDNEDTEYIFERIPVLQENGDETLKASEIDIKNVSDEQTEEIKSVKQESIKEEQRTDIKTEPEDKANLDDGKDANDVKVKAEPIVEKMNTSEDEDAMSVTVDDSGTNPASTAILVNGKTSELNGDTMVAHTKCEVVRDSTTATAATSSPADIRLKKQKPRAKLNSIIQKLIDGVPARLEQLSKTPAMIAATASMAASATTADRISSSGGGAIGSLSHSLAHKVSPPSSAAAASRLVDYHHQHVSPRKRILRELEKVSLEDNNGCVNNASGGGGGGGAGSSSAGVGGKRSRAKGSSTTTTSVAAVVSKSMAPINLAPPQAKTIATTAVAGAAASGAATASTQPTRLNSSYSIHSLLGGSSSSSSCSSSSKKTHDQPATIISNVHHHHPHHHTLYASPASYPTRPLLGSPKSPEMSGSNGGKSPSHAASKKQRSPPYVAATGSPHPIDFGRRTPPDSYKLVQAHAQQQHQQQLHHSFFAPYVGAVVPPHIPQAGAASRDLLSPPRSSSASPREPAASSASINTTPHRTVPKKTASIRREFASPTAGSSNSSSTATSCPSPGERSTASPERRHLHSAAAAAGSPLHYYMYPPAQLNGNAPGAVANASAAAAAAAAAAAYIPSPSLYHPYISTFAAMRHNPLWGHHYQPGAASLLPPPPHPQTSGAAAARLSPQSPYHPFGYNGVSAAALAAAAAVAASAFGQPTSNPHLGHAPHPAALSHHTTPPTHLAEHRTHTPKLTDTCTDQISAASSLRTTVSSSPVSASVGAVSAGTTTTTSSSSLSVQSAMFQNSSLRNELSSDLPLNLSKH